MKHTLKNGMLADLAKSDKTAEGDVMTLIYPRGVEQAELLVAVRPADYSAAKMAQAVEDCDLHLINLNVTSARTPDGDLVVALRVDSANPEGVTRSLERYGFMVIDAVGSQMTIAGVEAGQRVDEIIHLLEL